MAASYRITRKTRLLLQHGLGGSVYLLRFAAGSRPRSYEVGLPIGPGRGTSSAKAVEAESLRVDPPPPEWYSDLRGRRWYYERGALLLRADGRTIPNPETGAPYFFGASQDAYGRLSDAGSVRWEGGSEPGEHGPRPLHVNEAVELFGFEVDEMFEILGRLTGERFPDGTYE